MKVDVIVISYNQERYIKQCLNSILNQKVNTEIKINIIVGDDASDDSTVDIIKELAQNNININPVYRKKNIGASANVMELLKLAEGKYIFFCEGDDYWTDRLKIQKQIDFLENSEYIACTHNILLVNENAEIINVQELIWITEKKITDIFSYDGEHLPGHLSSLCVKNIFSKLDLSVLTTDRNTSDRIIFLGSVTTNG